VHSTGAEGRLNRFKTDSAVNFSDSDYSKEELIAEIGAAFLCNHAGISNATMANSVAYIDSWLKALQADKKMVVYAAARAQKAADYILGEVPGEYQQKQKEDLS
jgi:antirestriction protein ArdC